MKRILALLMVLCMMAGLLACKNPTADTPTTEATLGTTTPIRDDISDIKEDDLLLRSDDVSSNDAYINPAKHGGKTLQIAGLESDTFDDLDNMGKGNYNWMIRAAIADWAALNNVTVTFETSYNATDMMATINSGTKLDIVLGSNEYPTLGNLGLTKGFTQAQYDVLEKICGPIYLDLKTYKGEIHGVTYPWGGNHTYYFNATVFEQYGAKNPIQYVMEDNWTWATMEQSWIDTSRDFDSNGKFDGQDTFGMGGTSVHLTYGLEISEDPITGKLTDTMLTNSYYREYHELIYRSKYQTMCHSLKGTNYCKTTATPRAIAQVGDCEWYNFEHLYQFLENGDLILTTTLPAFNDGVCKQYQSVRGISLLSSCDEDEAAFDLICYILKVGMRYMADYSVGLYQNDYEGVRGASDFSKGWLKNFQAVCEDRRAKFAEIEDWDQAHFEKMVKMMFAKDNLYVTKVVYSGSEKSKVKTENLTPESYLPLLSAENAAFCTKYNELYAK